MIVNVSTFSNSGSRSAGKPRRVRRLASPLALLILLLSAGCGGEHEAAPAFETDLPGAGYNVSIILIDTLRPDHLGCYGYDKPTSPRIDALAAEGVVFEEARTASTFTGEAVASLFTGRPPAMIRDGLGWSARPTPMEENLPKRLEAAEYRTGIFSTSFVMRFRGFYDSFQESALFPGIENTSELDQKLTEEALAFAERHQSEPLFQYLHYYAPHAPYNPPDAYIAPFEPDLDVLAPGDDVHPCAMVSQGMKADDPRLAELKKHYDAEIALIDETVGNYLDGLRALGLDQKTIVVLLSDHGEEFLEHGFADHAWNLYDETLRIPLVIWAPALFSPARVPERVSIVDVMPTLLRCLQIPHTSYAGTVSGSYLFTPGEERWRYTPRTGPIYASLFPESRAQLHAVLFDDYKYISGPRWLSAEASKRFWLLQGRLAAEARRNDFLPLDPWAAPEKAVLYNLRTDPEEQQDIASEALEAAERGRVFLEDYKAASAPYRADPSQTTLVDPFGEERIEEMLRALSESGQQPGVEGDGHERLSPDVIEGLETMGYL